jgi:hypothetical protein
MDLRSFTSLLCNGANLLAVEQRYASIDFSSYGHRFVTIQYAGVHVAALALPDKFVKAISRAHASASATTPLVQLFMYCCYDNLAAAAAASTDYTLTTPRGRVPHRELALAAILSVMGSCWVSQHIGRLRTSAHDSWGMTGFSETLKPVTADHKTKLHALAKRAFPQLEEFAATAAMFGHLPEEGSEYA